MDVVLLAARPGSAPPTSMGGGGGGQTYFLREADGNRRAGVRSVLESVEVATKTRWSPGSAGVMSWRGGSFTSGFTRGGPLGDLRAVYATYYAARSNPCPRRASAPRTWATWNGNCATGYNFTWLSGDGYVEQACHSVDKGGLGVWRSSLAAQRWLWRAADVKPLGNIFDHMFVVQKTRRSAGV